MSEPARNLERITDHLAGWLARNEKGDVITRSAQCECGNLFQQSMLNPAFIDSSPGVAREFMRQIPDGWVPIFCPSCERKDLARQANRVHFP